MNAHIPRSSGMLLFLLTAALSAAAPAHAEISEMDAREKAKAAVREAWGTAPNNRTDVEAIRREDLEWRIFGAQVKIKGRIAVPVYLYELSLSGYEILSPEDFVFFTVLDANPRWFVAVLRADGDLFKLAGFDEADAEFNRMASRIEFKVPREVSPVSWALDFLELTRGEEERRTYVTPLHLRQAIERHFYGQYSPDSLSSKLYERWWRKYGKQVEKLRFEYEVEKREDRFLVRFVMAQLTGRPLPPSEWHSPLEAPRVEEWTIEVFPEGRCNVAAKKTLVGGR